MKTIEDAISMAEEIKEMDKSRNAGVTNISVELSVNDYVIKVNIHFAAGVIMMRSDNPGFWRTLELYAAHGVSYE